ncbi:hypothetical protein [Streptomyces paludis]|uniref:hypothetical protein n=1 Tax=Streptomyces paludis TaxID=2282738 RepID=UPI001E515B98|nr:hypothetical protein [Streptomyces paludis]
MSAVATLFAAFLICLGGGSGAVSAAPSGASGASDVAYVTHEGGTAHTVTAPAEAGARYICPYGKGDCGFFPHLSPAVLTVPPPVAPLADGVQLSHLTVAHPVGRAPRSGAHARAPDLHVLQVLRT